ncbi:hypothetical protein [Caulobacter hibisci]|uniref:Sulfotransferase family protein n=1 Tax=Caulobacter hibisci TaxID=2035993 RepID=A0ABS0SVB0_9CAUL|nr:hypothetical protein [Caulobacter hibisci]MBI1683339.1 hypothetical protein [Caulobacter hibisci]
MMVPVAPHDPSLAPVFVHSGWRCSSTYVWSRFRALPGVRAYYEPWHEHLQTMTHEIIARETPEHTRLRHPGGDRPYLAEFSELIAPNGGVAGYQERFALDGYRLDAEQDDAEQQAYVAGLVGHAQAQGEVPVLACCRTLGKIGWLKRRAGGFHIVLIRDPLQQWLSFYSLRKRPRPTYFEICQYVLMSEFAEADGLRAELRVPESRGRGFAGRLAAVRERLKRAPAAVSFAAFLAVYILSYLKALPEADLVIDVDRLGRDADYTATVSKAVAAGCGLAPDFSDCRTPEPRDTAPAVAYRRISRRVVERLDVRAALAAPGATALLFGKLARAMVDAPEPAPSSWKMLGSWLRGRRDVLATAIARRAAA